MEFARAIRQQSHITTSPTTAAMLSDLADRYESMACGAYDAVRSGAFDSAAIGTPESKES